MGLYALQFLDAKLVWMPSVCYNPNYCLQDESIYIW